MGAEHKPDAHSRRLVSALALNLVPQNRICLHVGVSEHTLKKAYRRELDLSREIACAIVANSLIRIATRENHWQLGYRKNPLIGLVTLSFSNCLACHG